jgi:hypothetical protein
MLDPETSVREWHCERVLSSHGQRRFNVAMTTVGIATRVQQKVVEFGARIELLQPMEFVARLPVIQRKSRCAGVWRPAQVRRYGTGTRQQ